MELEGRNQQLLREVLCGEKLVTVADKYGISAPRVRGIMCKQHKRWREYYPDDFGSRDWVGDFRADYFAAVKRYGAIDWIRVAPLPEPPSVPEPLEAVGIPDSELQGFDYLEISHRSSNCLKKAVRDGRLPDGRISTLENMTDQELKRLRNLGLKSVYDIRVAIFRRRLEQANEALERIPQHLRAGAFPPSP